MTTRITVPTLKRNSGSFRHWSRKLEAFLSLQNPPLNQFLSRAPDVNDPSEVAKDANCLSYIMLYVEDSLTEIIDGSPNGHAAYVALDTELRAVLQIRKSVNNQQISQLQQGTRSLEEYLLHAQKLMSEARDVEVSAHMEQL
jgi:hypothetical protein